MAWNDKYVTADSDGGDGSSGNPWTLAEAIASVAAGDRVNVKAGTYANTTSNRAFATAGTTNAPIWWRGYKDTAGDLDAAPTSNRTAGTDMPLFTFTSGQFQASAASNKFSAIAVTASALNGGTVSASGGFLEFHSCRFENTTANSASEALTIGTNHWVSVHRCYLKSTTTASRVAITTRAGLFQGCYFDGGAVGVYVNTSVGTDVIGCVFDSLSSDGIYVGNVSCGMLISGNTFYNLSGHGINYTTSAINGFSRVTNNLFHTITQAGKYGIYYGNATASSYVIRSNNAYYNVTNPETGFGDSVDFDRVSESSDPLDNPGANDFDLKSTALSKASGMPGLFEGVTFTSYLDIGAVQRAEPAASGGIWMPRARQVGV